MPDAIDPNPLIVAPPTETTIGGAITQAMQTGAVPAAPAPVAPSPAAPAPAPTATSPQQTVAAPPPAAPAPPAVNPHAVPKNVPELRDALRQEHAARTAAEKRAADALAIVETHAASRMAAAPENVRKAVESIAGTDPAARLRALDALAANGIAPGVVPTGATTTAAPTTPGANAPASPPSDPDIAAARSWTELRSKSPVLAAAMRAANTAAIERGLTKMQTATN